MVKQRLKISYDEVRELLGAERFEFPKYSTQLLNLANQNAQGTRPAVVGQMSELIQEFSGQSIEEWEAWYLERHPDAIPRATAKVKEMIDHFKSVIPLIDDEMIENWLKDLVIIKTFIGLKFQDAILKKSADLLGTGYRLSIPEEESQGIDGYIGEEPVSIKPASYKSKKGLMEEIDASLIFYEKTKTGITVDISDLVQDQN